MKRYEAYTNAYLTKRVGSDEFSQVLRTLGELWIQMLTPPRVK